MDWTRTVPVLSRGWVSESGVAICGSREPRRVLTICGDHVVLGVEEDG